MQLEINEVSVALGKEKKPILNQISFTVPDGNFVALLGPSGAGKSTLLKVLAGTLLQDSGQVLVDGASIDALPPHKRNLGFVYQDIRLFPNMNVEQNVAFGLKMRKVPKARQRQVVDELLDRVQLSGMGSRSVQSLSGGQAQRVAFARALACEPQVLLLDEPFSGLDELLRDDMRSLILKLHRESGITTLMVTHDAIEALEMADLIIYLEGGRVLQSGAPRDLYEHPAAVEVASCFGDCSTLNGFVESQLFHCCGLALPAPGVPDGEASCVIRFVGISAQPVPGWVDGGSIPVRCGVYRGAESLTRFDLEGQTLTVPGQTLLPAGSEAAVYVDPQNYFVFSA